MTVNELIGILRGMCSEDPALGDSNVLIDTGRDDLELTTVEARPFNIVLSVNP